MQTTGFPWVRRSDITRPVCVSSWYWAWASALSHRAWAPRFTRSFQPASRFPMQSPTQSQGLFDLREGANSLHSPGLRSLQPHLSSPRPDSKIPPLLWIFDFFVNEAARSVPPLLWHSTLNFLCFHDVCHLGLQSPPTGPLWTMPAFGFPLTFRHCFSRPCSNVTLL